MQPVIKTVAIHWMVFTIGETHQDERERKFLVAAFLDPTRSVTDSFFLSFFFSCDNRCVSSRDSCVSSEMLVHRFPRREVYVVYCTEKNMIREEDRQTVYLHVFLSVHIIEESRLGVILQRLKILIRKVSNFGEENKIRLNKRDNV